VRLPFAIGRLRKAPAKPAWAWIIAGMKPSESSLLYNPKSKVRTGLSVRTAAYSTGVHSLGHLSRKGCNL